MIARLPTVLVPACLEQIVWARGHGTCNMAIEVFDSLHLQIKEIAHDIEHFNLLKPTGHVMHQQV